LLSGIAGAGRMIRYQRKHIYAAICNSVKTAPAICRWLMIKIVGMFVHENHVQGRIAAQSALQ
jgi:hypothetical protein